MRIIPQYISERDTRYKNDCCKKKRLDFYFFAFDFTQTQVCVYVCRDKGDGIIILHRIISSPETGSLMKVQASPGGLLWRDFHSRPSDQLLL